MTDDFVGQSYHMQSLSDCFVDEIETDSQIEYDDDMWRMIGAVLYGSASITDDVLQFILNNTGVSCIENHMTPAPLIARGLVEGNNQYNIIAQIVVSSSCTNSNIGFMSLHNDGVLYYRYAFVVWLDMIAKTVKIGKYDAYALSSSSALRSLNYTVLETSRTMSFTASDMNIFKFELVYNVFKNGSNYTSGLRVIATINGDTWISDYHNGGTQTTGYYFRPAGLSAIMRLRNGTVKIQRWQVVVQ